MYPDLHPADNQIAIRFGKNVPWLNNRYVIYRQNTTTMAFDSIGYTDTEEYVDKGLANGYTYTYRVKAYGYRQIKQLTYQTLNWSHINSSAALDTTPSCPPVLTDTTLCDSLINRLTWTNPNHTCANDVVKYNVYYKPKTTDDFSLLATIDNPNDTIYRHHLSEISEGFYVVTAVDSFKNESIYSNMVQTKKCGGYSLPNVFTPNNDGFNDIYKSINPQHYVEKVDMKIFNRWGKLVFHTTDPDINWDGRDQETKQYVSPGVYYYFCDVYEPSVVGIYLHNLHDLVYVFYKESTKPAK
jgi:gliding motility-associated-like protein